MSGALIHLSRNGTFVKDPEYTLFSVDTTRRNVYTAESLEIPFDSKTYYGQKATALIPRKGDVARRFTVSSVLPPLYNPLGPGYVYPLYTDQVDGTVYVQTNTIGIQPGDFVGYFNTQFLNAWATNFVGYSNLSVAYDSTSNKFVFTSPTYANIFFKNEQSASFWGFDIRSPDFFTPTGSYPAYNFTNGTLVAPLTLVQAGWIRGFTPPPTTGGFSYVESVACKLIKEATLSIGGQVIDRLTSERLIIEDDLGIPYENQGGLTILQGKNDTSTITAAREYYTRLNFNIDTLSMNALQNQDVRVNVEYEKFENLPSSLITTNSLTDGASYINTPWKTLVNNTNYADVYSIVFWKTYVIYLSGRYPSIFYFYDTTKPVGIASSWTTWVSPFNDKAWGRMLTIGGSVYIFDNTVSSLIRLPIDDMLAGTAVPSYGCPMLDNKYTSLNVQVGVSGGVDGYTADARYLYINYDANMISFGSNSAALFYTNRFVGMFGNPADSNLTATFNVYSISTTSLIPSENTAVINYVNTYAPVAPGGVTRNSAVIVSQVKIGSNLVLTSNVTYVYTSNGQPAPQTWESPLGNGTNIWIRYDTEKPIASQSSYDYLTWAGTGAPKSFYDITGSWRQSVPTFSPVSDGRYIYASNPYFIKVDTQNFLAQSSYTYFNTGTLSPAPYLGSAAAAVPNVSDGRYVYFGVVVAAGSTLTFIRYDSTLSVSSPSSWSSIVYNGITLPTSYELYPTGFDGKSVYYTGTTYPDIAMTMIRMDASTFSITDWIIFNRPGGTATTSNGLVSNTITFTSSTHPPYGSGLTVGIPTVLVGSRYIYIGEIRGSSFETLTDFIQFDPLTMSGGPPITSSLITKFETYDKKPPLSQIALYGQTDVNTFTFIQGRLSDSFQLKFINPCRELWFVIQTPGVISRIVVRLNNEILVDDDQVTTRYIRTFETHSTMPTSSNVCVYSLCLNPEKLSSSGTLNMSRIAYPSVDVTLVSAAPSNLTLTVYNKSFNALGYQGGVGGVLFNSAL